MVGVRPLLWVLVVQPTGPAESLNFPEASLPQAVCVRPPMGGLPPPRHGVAIGVANGVAARTFHRSATASPWHL